MITGLRLKNFKSWEDTGDIAFKPLTVFFGTNSSGKSSLLQSLLMMKQSLYSYDRRQILDLGNEESLVDLGSFRNLVFQHETGRSILLSLKWNHDIIDQSDKRAILFSAPAEMQSEISLLNNQITINRIMLAAPESLFSDRLFVISGAGYDIGQSRGQRKVFEVSLTNRKYLATDNTTISINPEFDLTPISFYEVGRQVGQLVSELFPAVGTLFTNQLHRLQYIGSIRARPERTYSRKNIIPESVGADGCYAIDILIEEYAIEETSGSPSINILEKLNIYLKKLQLVESIEVSAIDPDKRYFEVLVQEGKHAPKVSLMDIGLGVSQVLPVLIACLYAQPGTCLILEHPELHLHPSAQVGLADLIIDTINDRHIQILVESHSEHFLNRLQRRMAEGAVDPAKVAVYFVERGQGKSVLRNMTPDEYGAIQDWPEGFFGSERDDLLERARAVMRRKREAIQEPPSAPKDGGSKPGTKAAAKKKTSSKSTEASPSTPRPAATRRPPARKTKPAPHDAGAPANATDAAPKRTPSRKRGGKPADGEGGDAKI